AQLTVRASISPGTLRKNNAGNQFVRLEPAVVVAYASVELAKRNAACSCDAGNLDFSIQAQERRRRISRERRPALAPTRCHVTEIAIFLNTEPARLPPSKRLVIPKAPRVEAYVAADRAHVADDGRRNVARRFDKNRVLLPQQRGVFNLTQSSQRANLNSLL